MVDSKPHFIVGIGGSAGGLKAYTELLLALPANTGMAFVFISHLNPRSKSLLADLLSRKTHMLAAEASEGMSIKANHIYVIPPNANLFMENFAFRVISPRTMNRGLHQQVNLFLESLAQNMGDRAIGIILSGGDGDGTQGCKSIKAHGGITFAQDLSADDDSMPLSAQASGCVDYVLAPDKIALKLTNIALGKKRPAINIDK